MRRGLALLLILAGTARAAEPPKPNLLTPKEIADGWVLLFDGETTFGWKTEGAASTKDGALVLGGDKPTLAQVTAAFPAFVVEFEYKAEVPQQAATPEFWAFSSRVLENVGPGKKYKSYPFSVFLNASDTWSVGRYEFRDGGHKAAVGNIGSESPWSEPPPFAAAINVPAGTLVRIRNLKLKPYDLRLLLSGKDLTGWKQYTGDEKRAKSKFTVTPEGWLNIANGPGDLQTEKQWADFVFQGECISNGKHLNSGVFFRCIPGQYQQGYEYQIQNGYKDNDRTKPEDFGTGAIYRRVKARKVVPNDHEWFTMTLIANGKHIRTWVNGYPTVDWTDDRKESNNAREGCKLGAGPISLQGHDPTTNLSFRNLRVSELR